MAYIPDPTLVTQPIEIVDASTAAAEFRALKAYIAAALGLSAPLGFQGFKNKLINGTGFIDQRRAGTVVDAFAASAYGPDRWKISAVGVGTLRLQRFLATSMGYSSFRITALGADAALAGSDSYYVFQVIEGYNVADLVYGTVAAKTCTLRFRAMSSIAGIHSGAFHNVAVGRSYVFTFTIAAANVPEDFFIIIPGEAGLVTNTTNGKGLELQFNMGQQAGALTTPNTWQTGIFLGATGSVQLINTVNSYLELTNVQFETGSVPTAFEQLPFELELARCLRYYEKSFPYTTVPVQNAGTSGAFWCPQYVAASTSQNIGSITWNVRKRIAPTAVLFNPSAANAQIRGSVGADWSASVVGALSETSTLLSGTTPAGSAVGNAGTVHYTADADY